MEDEGGSECMYHKMFIATGGARMGMRARAAQNGKLARTEGGVSTTGSDSTEDAAQSTVEILEERRKRKQAKKTGGADGQERDPGPDTIEEKEVVESETPVKKRRKIVQTSEGDLGEGSEMTDDGTRSKTQKKRSKAKKSDRCDKAARGIATKGKAGKGTSNEEGKGGKKKRERGGKGL